MLCIYVFNYMLFSNKKITLIKCYFNLKFFGARSITNIIKIIDSIITAGIIYNVNEIISKLTFSASSINAYTVVIIIKK